MPRTIDEPTRDSIETIDDMDDVESASPRTPSPPASRPLRAEIEELRSDMECMAAEIAFEEAAKLRVRMKELEAMELRR